MKLKKSYTEINSPDVEQAKPYLLLRRILLLQGIIIIYTLAGVMGKLASCHPILSIGFIGFYALEIFILGIYAFLWQQIIKHFDLTIAYANRAVALLWSGLWAVFFFHEVLTIQNILGIVIVILGMAVVNTDGK